MILMLFTFVISILSNDSTSHRASLYGEMLLVNDNTNHLIVNSHFIHPLGALYNLYIAIKSLKISIVPPLGSPLPHDKLTSTGDVG